MKNQRGKPVRNAVTAPVPSNQTGPLEVSASCNKTKSWRDELSDPGCGAARKKTIPHSGVSSEESFAYSKVDCLANACWSTERRDADST